MSTVTEIKAAIEKLSPKERAELDSLVWPEWDRPLAPEQEAPPVVRQKLEEASGAKFSPGDRKNIEKILSSLE